MHLMYTLDDNGNRVYTLKKITDLGKITKSAQPARVVRPTGQDLPLMGEFRGVADAGSGCRNGSSDELSSFVPA
ncbi:hypothetical protein C8Q80DRAFT_1276438 [Daedaleopsis nitida]|nr:hypothetical protein C8Q80DRAFT_1276438 [Daedaleopsis nitida]